MEEHEPGADELDPVGSPQHDDDAGEQRPAETENAGSHTPTNDPDPDPDELPDDDDEPDSDETDGDTAPTVARARQQAARYRRQLRDTETERDELAAALWTARVDQLGVLADPDDLPFDPDALHDPDRLRQLVDELVTAKPHLRSRRIRARAGQGEGSPPGGISLAAILNRGA